MIRRRTPASCDTLAPPRQHFPSADSVRDEPPFIFIARPRETVFVRPRTPRPSNIRNCLGSILPGQLPDQSDRRTDLHGLGGSNLATCRIAGPAAAQCAY